MTEAEPRRSPSSWAFAGGLLGGALFVAGMLGLVFLFDLEDETVELLEWIRSQGAWAPVLFVLVMAAAVVLILPGAPLTVGAGFVFGTLQGSLWVVLGTTLGATAAFGIARGFLGERAERWLLDRPRMGLLARSLERRGWRVVLASRLVPLFPGKLANYAFGLTSVSLRGYVLGSALGFVPLSVHNVYLGSLAGRLAEAGDPDTLPGHWTAWVAGALLAAVGVFLLGRWGWRTLQSGAEAAEGGAEPAGEEARA